MHYKHGIIAAENYHGYSIYVNSASYGYYNSFYVGNMVDDTNYCAWTGYHVHDELWLGPYPVGLPGYDKRLNFLVVGQPYQNNAHWTRYTAWGEGGYQP